MENVSSGAYGIPQSPLAAKWRYSAQTGVTMRPCRSISLSYIVQRYGSPSKVWEHSEQVGMVLNNADRK